MSNPAFRSPAFQPGAQGAVATATAQQLQEMYDQPSAQRPTTEPMTIQDTLVKSGLTFAVLLIGAVAGWISTTIVLQNLAAQGASSAAPAMGIFVGAAVVALVLGLVNAF